jgi:ADP-heptose:LPS heptosyltransferase
MSAHDSKEKVLHNIIKKGIENFIIITGGIGDFLTIDFYLNYSSKKHIIFITKQSLKLKELMKTYNFSNKFYSLYFDFSKIGKPGFDTKNELIEHFPEFNNIRIVDIVTYFPKIKKLLNKVNFYNNFYNNIYSNKLFNICDNNIKSKYQLPDKYAVIVPYTEDNRIFCIDCKVIHNTQIDNCGLTRNFTNEDYNNTFMYLKNNNIKGILIGVNHITVDNQYNDYVINLSGKLTIRETIDITKHSSYYFGIDSFLSVIASKILGDKFIFMKCNNDHAHKHKNIYWYPNKFIKLRRFIEL